MRTIVRHAERLLDQTSTHEQLNDACLELYDIFVHASGLGHGNATRDDTSLSTGQALAAKSAAACLLDTNRTVAFVRGLWAAICEAQRRFRGETIEVVYAGTGPFASLAVPLMPLLNPRNIRLSLIEVNAHSISLLKRLITKLQFAPRITRIVNRDAAHYRHTLPIHVAVTETMQRALSKEPFAAIAQNLRRQLAPGGLFVPERVTVTAAAIDAEGEKVRWNGAPGPESHRRLARLLQISSSHEVPPFEGGQSAPVLVTFPDPAGREYWVGLLTEIATFGSERLRCYDSGLTMPEILWPLSPMLGDETIEFRYCISASPGIKWRRSRRFLPTA